MSKLSRREFTKRVGLAALFSPFMSLVKRAPASAAPVGKAKYLLIFYTNGTDVPAWTPTGSAADNLVFSQMTQPLDPLRPSLLLVDRLSSMGTADNHAAPGGLTGRAMADRPGSRSISSSPIGCTAAGVVTQIPNLILGSVKTEQQTSFYRNNQALSPIFSPVAAYDAIFGAVGGVSPATLAAAQERARSGEQRARAAVGSARRPGAREARAPRRSRSARSRIGSAAVGRAAVQAGERPPEATQDLLGSVDSPRARGHRVRLRSDPGRVGAIRPSPEYPGVIDRGGQSRQLAQRLHPRRQSANAAGSTSSAGCASSSLRPPTSSRRLPAPTGSGTLFDQTLMVWARDMGDAVKHNGSNMRFVFSGGAGGYLTTSANGRYIDGGSEAHQRALCNCAAAMGITDMNGFGDVTQSRTPLASVGM